MTTHCSLTLVPPSPVTDCITLDIRAAVRNGTASPVGAAVTFHVDTVSDANLILKQCVTVPANSSAGVSARWPTSGHEGFHEIIMTAAVGGQENVVSRQIEILGSGIRSTERIDGAWAGIYHWSEEEGRLWNQEIGKMTDDQWRELVRGMHGIAMDIIVLQESIRNQEYCGKHEIEKLGYHGKAFYPSHLFPGRMPIAAKNPIEAILGEADKQGMHVFLGIGLYAWFDFTPASLEWHKQVASELWELYGHHPSFYGWYVGEEAPGSLDNWASDASEQAAHKRKMVAFFKGFKTHCAGLAPDKPVMLATNCHAVPRGLDTYPELLKHLDILCPFGFHRMPEGDISGEDAATILQKLCDEAGCHLWMDMEVFLFDPKNALYPRPVAGLLDDMKRFPNFEKILCYQYPGLMNAPDASRKPGGEDTVKLYEDYRRYLEGWERERVIGNR